MTITELDEGRMIAGFLLARIGEEQAEAERQVEDGYGHLVESGWPATRVVAECEAKRRIVELCVEAMEGGAVDGQLMTSGAHLADEVLRAMAAVYADHPDFNPDWSGS